MEDLQGGTLVLEHRYRLEESVGTLGIWDRYAGSAQPFDKKVWIDVAHEALWDDSRGLPQSICDRVRDAIQVSGTLTAEGVLRIIDFGEFDENSPFVVTERTEAESLEDYLQRQETLSEDETARLMLRLVQILGAAAERGVHHGNLHPRCIFIPNGDIAHAEISHFGLGVSVDEWRTASESEALLERVNELLWAPEALNSDHLATTEADIYSVCVIAYRALVGLDPVPEVYSVVDLQVDAGGYESWQALTALGVENRLAQIIERGLSTDPHLRWTHFAMLEQELAAMVVEESVSPFAHDTVPEIPSIDPPSTVPVSTEPVYDSEVTLSPLGPVLMGIASLAVVVSVGSLLFFTHQAYADRQPEPETTPSILLSEPSGAEVFEITSDNPASVLGRSPLIVPESTNAAQVRTFEVRHPGFESSRIDMVRTDLGKEWTIHLNAKP